MFVLALAMLLLGPARASASFATFTDFDAWQTSAGDFASIGFNELPDFTFVNDQYASLGVTFSSPWDYTGCCDFWDPFNIDGAGLYANGVPVTLDFDAPQLSLGIHHPGGFRIRLYADTDLLFDSGFMGGSGQGFFSGIVGTTGFNRAVIDYPFDELQLFAIDNIYFGGAPIPAPGGLVLLGAIGLGRGRRRRRA